MSAPPTTPFVVHDGDPRGRSIAAARPVTLRFMLSMVLYLVVHISDSHVSDLSFSPKQRPGPIPKIQVKMQGWLLCETAKRVHMVGPGGFFYVAFATQHC